MILHLLIPEVRSKTTNEILDLVQNHNYEQAGALARDNLESSCSTEEIIFYNVILGIHNIQAERFLEKTLMPFGAAWALAPGNCKLQIEIMIAHIYIQYGCVKRAKEQLEDTHLKVIKKITKRPYDEILICLRNDIINVWQLIDKQSSDIPKLPALKFKENIQIIFI